MPYSQIFRNERYIIELEPNAPYNNVHIVLTNGILFAGIYTDFDKLLQIFPVNLIALVDTFDTFLFTTLCSDLNIQVKIFCKLMFGRITHVNTIKRHQYMFIITKVIISVWLSMVLSVKVGIYFQSQFQNFENLGRHQLEAVCI